MSFNASDGTIVQAYWYGLTVPSATYKALDTSSGRVEMYAPKIYGGQFDGSSVGGSDDELVLDHANINNAYIDNTTLTGCDLSNPKTIKSSNCIIRWTYCFCSRWNDIGIFLGQFIQTIQKSCKRYIG